MVLAEKLREDITARILKKKYHLGLDADNLITRFRGKINAATTSFEMF